MKRLVILNPTARRASRCEELLEEMSADPGTELRRTAGPGDASSLARRARVDDGRLDAVVIEAGPMRRIPGLVVDVLRGRHLGRDDVHHVRAASVSVRARPPMWVSLDGEVLGDSALRLTVVPDALRVFAPEGR